MRNYHSNSSFYGSTKNGTKKSLVIGNILNVVSLFIFVFCRNLTDLFIHQFVNAIAFAFKGICEPSILHDSIPDTDKKGEIYSNIDSKGYSKYCYICAISAMLSGFFFEINPYIPLILCIIFLAITVILSYNFIEVNKMKPKEERQIELQITLKESLQDLKIGFEFIFKSKRLKSLLLIIGLIWGVISLCATYEVTLLQYMKVSAGAIGVILAVLQILTGIISKKANDFHNRYRNKTLTILAYTCTIGMLIAGGAAIMRIPYFLALLLILATYVLRAAAKGIYQIIKQRYLNNFTNSEILPKISAANNVISNVGRMTLAMIGSAIIGVMEIPYAMITDGILFSILVFFLARYMHTRLGLKPEEYRKEDINYKIVK